MPGRRMILFAELVAPREDTRLPKECMIFGELMGDAGCLMCCPSNKKVKSDTVQTVCS